MDENSVDRHKLARLMLRWYDTRQVLDLLEQDIEAAVLRLRETVQTGNVVARYTSGRKTYDYKAAAGDDPDPYVVMQYTESKVNWRAFCLEELGLDQEEIPFKQGDPSVSVKVA